MVGKTIGKNDVISTSGWLLNLIVLIIPIVGLVVYIVWAFGNGNLNRRNYARATLILLAAGIIFGIISSAAITSFIKPLIGSFLGS